MKVEDLKILSEELSGPNPSTSTLSLSTGALPKVLHLFNLHVEDLETGAGLGLHQTKPTNETFNMKDEDVKVLWDELSGHDLLE